MPSGGTTPAVGGSQPDGLAVALGYINWPVPPFFANADSALTSGAIFVQSVWLPAGKAITGAVVAVQTPAAGTKPTGLWVGLADSTTKMLAQSGDLSGAAGSPLAAAGQTKLAFSAPHTTPSSGLYYAMILMTGTYGTTQPTVLTAARTAGGFQLGTGLVAAGDITGQTGLPANGSSLPAFTNQGTGRWIAVY